MIVGLSLMGLYLVVIGTAGACDLLYQPLGHPEQERF